MHVNQPSLPRRTLLDACKSKLLVDLVISLCLLEAFCKLVAVVVSLWLSLCGGAAATASATSSAAKWSVASIVDARVATTASFEGAGASSHG